MNLVINVLINALNINTFILLLKFYANIVKKFQTNQILYHFWAVLIKTYEYSYFIPIKLSNCCIEYAELLIGEIN